jgi:hypothetical protein
MQLLLRHKLLIGGATIALAAGGGAAYAATQSGATGQQAFVNDVAKRLNVSPAQLRSAVKAALIDQLNAEVKAGRLTQAQANKIEQQINQNGRLPFLFAPGGPRPFVAPGGPRPFLFAPGGPRLFLAPGGAHKFLHVEARGGGLVHAAASYLGLTNAKLLSDLQSGKSLAQIAKAQGKSVSGLEQAIETAAKTRLDKAVSNGRITKAQEQQLLKALSAGIAQLVNQTGIGAPLPGGPGFWVRPGERLPRKAQLPPGGMFLPGPAVGAPMPPGPGMPGPNA